MTTSIVVLAGGVGGSRFVLGLRDAVQRRWPGGRGAADDSGTVTGSSAAITVIANTGDDLWLSGVRLQPDIDSLLYALAGVNDAERGWGRAGESSRAWDEVAAFGAGWPWFTLGDLDLGTHLARTGWLRDAVPLAEIVRRLSGRWDLGGVRILPMTESEVDTHVVVAGADDGPGSGGARRMHFEEWWVRHRAALPALAFENPGISAAAPAPGVLEAIGSADVVLLAPSNPVVSIGPILDVPGIRGALRAARGRVVGVSPIIGGSVVRGMADACLAAIGVETAADAVGRLYGSRTDGGMLDAWLIGEEDAALAEPLRAAGLATVVTPLWMRDAHSAEALARAALDAALPA